MKSEIIRSERITTPYSCEENTRLMRQCLKFWNQDYHTIPRLGGEFSRRKRYFVVRYCFVNTEENLGHENYLVHLYARVTPQDNALCIDFIDDTAKWRSIAWKFVYPFLLLCILFAIYILYGSLSMLGCIIFTVVAAIVCALIFHFRFGWFLDISKEDLLNCFSELIVTNASAVFQVPLRTTAVQAEEGQNIKDDQP